MHTHSRPYSPARRYARAMAAGSLTIATVMLLAALPTASANTSSPSLTLPASVSALSPSEAEALLSGISLSDLDTTQLTEALSKLPGLSTLPAGKLEAAVTKVIESLEGKSGTLGELLEPSQVAPELAGELEKLLSVTELPALLTLLKGESLTTKLTTALGSLGSNQLLGTLLESTSEPEHLLDQLFAALNPETLESLFGSTLTGEPFSKTTVNELASELGMTSTTLAKELGTTPTALPENATALTAPLTDGKTLGVLDGLGGVTLSVLGSRSQAKETGEEGNGGSGKGGSGGSEGSGGSDNGGSGGSGSGGSNGSSGGGSGTPTLQTSPGATTVILSVAPGLATPAPAPSARASGKVKIIGHRVRGRYVTLVIRVPAAGKLALGGNGVKPVHRQAAKAERITLRTTLTRAAKASLHRHRRGLRVNLKASFKIAGGASSSATVTVAFA